jgi:hypothetical protein
MNIITKTYGKKIGVNFLIWDINCVTFDEIIKFWTLLIQPNVFHDVTKLYPRRIRKTEIAKIKSVLSSEHIDKFIISALKNIQTNSSMTTMLTNFERLIVHLVAMSLGYTSITKKERKGKKYVSCYTIGYYQSVKKAMDRGNNTPMLHGVCGCRYISSRLYRQIKDVAYHVMDGYDVNEMWYHIPYYEPIAINIDDFNHQRYVIEYILNEIMFFPQEINKLIARYT